MSCTPIDLLTPSPAATEKAIWGLKHIHTIEDPEHDKIIYKTEITLQNAIYLFLLMKICNKEEELTNYKCVRNDVDNKEFFIIVETHDIGNDVDNEQHTSTQISLADADQQIKRSEIQLSLKIPANRDLKTVLEKIEDIDIPDNTVVEFVCTGDYNGNKSKVCGHILNKWAIVTTNGPLELPTKLKHNIIQKLPRDLKIELLTGNSVKKQVLKVCFGNTGRRVIGEYNNNKEGDYLSGYKYTEGKENLIKTGNALLSAQEVENDYYLLSHVDFQEKYRTLLSNCVRMTKSEEFVLYAELGTPSFVNEFPADVFDFNEEDDNPIYKTVVNKGDSVYVFQMGKEQVAIIPCEKYAYKRVISTVCAPINEYMCSLFETYMLTSEEDPDDKFISDLLNVPEVKQEFLQFTTQHSYSESSEQHCVNNQVDFPTNHFVEFLWADQEIRKLLNVHIEKRRPNSLEFIQVIDKITESIRHFKTLYPGAMIPSKLHSMCCEFKYHKELYMRDEILVFLLEALHDLPRKYFNTLYINETISELNPSQPPYSILAKKQIEEVICFTEELPINNHKMVKITNAQGIELFDGEVVLPIGSEFAVENHFNSVIVSECLSLCIFAEILEAKETEESICEDLANSVLMEHLGC